MSLTHLTSRLSFVNMEEEEEEYEEDMISRLPDDILVHILSFLPTKQAFTTRVLSKRWKEVWNWDSSPCLDMDDIDCDGTKESHSRFVHNVYTTLSSQVQPIRKLRFHSLSGMFCNDPLVNHLINTVVGAKTSVVEHIDLRLRPWNYYDTCIILSLIFTCTTLVTLTLSFLVLKPFSFFSVNLPSLKLLHLDNLIFMEPKSLAVLLSGSPNLQDIKATDVDSVDHYNDAGIEKEFQTFPKLVRAHIPTYHSCFLHGFNSVQFLHIYEICYKLFYNPQPRGHYSFPMFHNLTHLELVYHRYNTDWSQVVELLHHCPKLQVLVITQKPGHYPVNGNGTIREFQKVRDWESPPSVPGCILLHLKRCYLNDYRDTKSEFEFVKYIMQNERFLESMTISSHIFKYRKRQIIRELSSRWRGRDSPPSKLSFI